MDKKQKYKNLLQPFPVRLRANKSKGRFISSKTELEAGTTVLEEAPIAFTVFQQFADEHCAKCLERFRLKRDPTVTKADSHILASLNSSRDAFERIVCQGCRNQTSYCSIECQRQDSTHHNLICEILVELPGICGMHSCDYSLFRLILNVLVNLHFCDPNELSSLQCVQDLLSHQQSMDPKWVDAVAKGAEDLQECVGKLFGVSQQSIVKLACRINSNSHAIFDHTGVREIGVGMFPLVAMLNHSCMPNCAFVSGSSGKMVVRTLTHVQNDEELCVSYVDLMLPTLFRQGKLLETKFFLCDCSRCRNDDSLLLDAPRCSQCLDCKMGLANNVYGCKGCGFTMSVDGYNRMISSYQNRLDTALDLQRIGQFSSSHEALGSLYDSCRKTLQKHHYVTHTVLINLINISSKMLSIKDALELIRIGVGLVREKQRLSLLPHQSIELADFLDTQAQMCNILIEGAAEGLFNDVNDDLGREMRSCLDESRRIRRIFYP